MIWIMEIICSWNYELFFCFYKGELSQYLGLGELSLQKLQGLSVSPLTVLQGGQLLLHLPLQHKQQNTDQWLVIGLQYERTVELNSIVKGTWKISLSI